MRAYPVHFGVARAARFTRLQLLVRLAVFLVLGMVGLSFGTIFGIAYLALPIYAAIRISSLGSPGAYALVEAPRTARALRWFAAVSGWAGLVVERLPAHDPDESVALHVDATEHESTAGSALARIVTGLPSALVLLLVGCVGVLVWLWAAMSILFVERVGLGAFSFLVGLQRWCVRLLAYQACLVDAYPPFTLSEGPPGELPHATAMA